MLRSGGSNSRRGSALVFALFVMSFVAAFAVAVLQLNTAVTKRQSHAVDDKRAFYLAEAGLSEAYFGLQKGMSGQIGSMEAPALVGDGLVWVDATEGEDGRITLRSTGLCDGGRSTLEIVVERTLQPFGIFADEGIDVSVPFLVDGYDSETTSYYEQAGMQAVVVDPTLDYKFGETSDGGMILYYRSRYFDVVDYDLDTLTFWYASMSDQADSVSLAPSSGYIAPTDPIGDGTASETPEGSADYDAFHTSTGGQLGSNGPINLASTTGESVQVYGDVVPGPEDVVVTEWGVMISGETTPRDELLELPPVAVPDVELLAGFEHTSLIPRVLPPADVGYESIRVGPDSELVVQGTSNLVVGDLILQDAGAMTIENEVGPVNLYVTGYANLAQGSTVEVESHETSDLSLQLASTATEGLLNATSQFHGMLYAPDSHVAIGSEFEVFGMLAANTLEIAPYSRLHFDSGVLGDSGAVPMPRLLGWRIDEIPAEVRQSRIDPFRLLQVDREELESITDSHEQSSWMVKAEHWLDQQLQGYYEGPLENWIVPPDMKRSIWVELAPPEKHAGEWNVYLRVQRKNGIYEYDGPIAGVPLPMRAQVIYEFRVTPPGM